MTPDLSFTGEPHVPESSVVRMDTQDHDKKAGEYHHRCDDRSKGVEHRKKQQGEGGHECRDAEPDER